MKSLNERKAARAARASNNASESTQAQTGNSLADAEAKMNAAKEAVEGLSKEDREQLEEAMEASPPEAHDPAEGDQNGVAIANQTSGWGGDNSGKPELKPSMAVADIEAIAQAEDVDISEASNNADRIALIEKARESAE